jgi:hypothetical protein
VRRDQVVRVGPRAELVLDPLVEIRMGGGDDRLDPHALALLELGDALV